MLAPLVCAHSYSTAFILIYWSWLIILVTNVDTWYDIDTWYWILGIDTELIIIPIVTKQTGTHELLNSGQGYFRTPIYSWLLIHSWYKVLWTSWYNTPEYWILYYWILNMDILLLLLLIHVCGAKYTRSEVHTTWCGGCYLSGQWVYLLGPLHCGHGSPVYMFTCFHVLMFSCFHVLLIQNWTEPSIQYQLFQQ